MKLLASVVIFCLISQNCISQTGIIKGHIHNKSDNQGVMFANVFLVDQNIGTVSNEAGDFLIENIPTGKYDLKLTYVGYPDTTISNIELVADTTIILHIPYPPECPFDGDTKVCPVCEKGDRIIPIVYGLPGKKLMTQSKRGKVFLGGCVVSGCDLNWYCKRDKREF